MTKITLIFIAFISLVFRANSQCSVNSLTVNNRLYIGPSIYLTATNYGFLQCIDENNDWVLFQCDPSDPSLEVPGAMVVLQSLQSIGPFSFNSEMVSHVSHPTNSNYRNLSKDVFILVPAGTNRFITLVSGPDGRLLSIKDSGTASGTNVTIVDVHGQKIDGQTSVQITNDYGCVNLIYDYVNLRWWTTR